MDFYKIAAQAVGIVAAVGIILSYQIKEKNKFYVLQSVGTGLFFINFLMLGAYTGAFINLINVFRGIGIISEKKGRPTISVVLSSVAYVVLTALTFSGVPSLVVCLAPLAAGYSMWTDNAYVIRYFQLIFISPVWIMYNTVFLNVGGILCEIFNMTSVIVFFCRMKRRKGEKDNNANVLL